MLPLVIKSAKKNTHEYSSEKSKSVDTRNFSSTRASNLGTHPGKPYLLDAYIHHIEEKDVEQIL